MIGVKKQVLWKSCGYSPFLGIPLKKHQYVLYEDSISVTRGISLQKTQTIPLYRIAAKEVSTSSMGRIFHCGTLRLITRGRELPDLELLVKEPQAVMDITEKAERDEQKRFASQQKAARQNRR